MAGDDRARGGEAIRGVDRVRRWQWHFASHRVLTTAAKVGLLRRLAAGPDTAAGHAAALGLDAGATAKVLRVLVAMGVAVAEPEGGEAPRYALPDDLAPWFAGGVDDFTPALLHGHEIYERWADVEGWLRSGRIERGPRDAARVRRFAEAMWANAAVLAPRAVARLDLAGVRRVLDLGGGTGRFAVALCEAAADLEVTVLDVPPVAELGPAFVGRTPHAGRVRFVAGDYLRSPLRDPDGRADFDLVVISNVLHQELAPEAARLVARAAAALRPGGVLAVAEFALDDDRHGPLLGTLFAVNMRDFGDTWTLADIGGWMRAAGLVGVERRDVDAGRWLVLARRPA